MGRLVTSSESTRWGCDAVCLPIADDLNCSAVEALGKAPVRVLGSDPYRLDGDGEGVPRSEAIVNAAPS